MNELAIIKYLLQEIEEEMEYSKNYKIAKEKAMKESIGTPYYYLYFMPERFTREPRKSVIKANVRTIRRLMLKVGMDA